VAARENPNALEDTHGNGDAVSDDGRQIVDLEAQIAELSNGGGGAGLPAQWTIDEATGNLLIEALPGDVFSENGLGGIAIKSTDDDNTFDVFVIQNADGSTTFGIDPFGYLSASGADLGALTNTTPLKVSASSGFLTTRDLASFAINNGSYVRIDHNGALIFKNNAAPADGDIGANECAIWFDRTNGAGKLMVKAKTQDGTVVAGELALA
jgi:hypothetical protein